MSSRIAPVSVGLAWLVAAPWVAGCSVIVGAPLDPAAPQACEIVDGWDPCVDVGGTCVDGYCATTFDVCNGRDDDGDGITDEGSETRPPCDIGRCVAGGCMTGCSAEICNGMDDDCDGAVDNGLQADADSDGVDACPAMGMRDCDDGNSMIHPANPSLGVMAAEEICNGLDDDCDPATSEDVAGEVCPVGQVCQRLPGTIVPECYEVVDCRVAGCTAPTVCDLATRRCSMPPDDCRTGGGCPSPLMCNEATGTCDTPPPGGIGAPCDVDAQCESKLCVSRAALDIRTGDRSGVCGVACCNDADCDTSAGERCWAPGTGARSCVTAAVYGDASASLCSGGSDCSAGACRDGSVTYTAEGSTRSFDGMVCSAPPDFPSTRSYCVGGVIDCVNGVCLGNGICAAPCEESEDCAAQYPDWFPDEQYAPICGLIASGRSVFTGCVEPGGGTGTTGDGMTCLLGSECRDELCFNGACADVCCSDRNCPTGYRCAPIERSIGMDRRIWPMRCVQDDTPVD